MCLRKSLPDDGKVNRLIYWGRRFHELGLATNSAGNLSFRTKNGFVITATGINLGTIEKEDLVEVLKVEVEKGQILVYVSGGLFPSKESLLHSEIYRLRGEINAVFHAHDPLVLEFADELGIPSTETEQPGGSYELAKEASKLLRLTEGVKYFVLRNHGIVSMGETLEAAGRLAECMNRMASSKTLRG